MEQLGIDWKILVAQIINFAILLYLLKRFAYKPFLKLLEARKKKIEQGLEKSEQAQRLLLATKESEKKIKEAAERKAREIMLASEERAKKRAEEIFILAEKEKKEIIERAKKLAREEALLEKQKKEKEIMGAVLTGMEKFLGEKMDSEKDQKLIQKLINES